MRRLDEICAQRFSSSAPTSSRQPKWCPTTATTMRARRLMSRLGRRRRRRCVYTSRGQLGPSSARRPKGNLETIAGRMVSRNAAAGPIKAARRDAYLSTHFCLRGAFRAAAAHEPAAGLGRTGPAITFDWLYNCRKLLARRAGPAERNNGGSIRVESASAAAAASSGRRRTRASCADCDCERDEAAAA